SEHAWASTDAAAPHAATATACAALWTLGTAEFALARILPGPRDPREIAGMLGTSVLIPPLAVRHWMRGVVRHRNARPLGGAG
ncbi:hypothetical protein ABZ760_37010, partial [Streptomyces sp. NPDC006658]